MPISKPTPLGIEGFIKSATMFYIDPELEKEFDDAVEKDVKEIKTELLRSEERRVGKECRL